MDKGLRSLVIVKPNPTCTWLNPQPYLQMEVTDDLNFMYTKGIHITVTGVISQLDMALSLMTRKFDDFYQMMVSQHNLHNSISTCKQPPELHEPEPVLC